ncbi:MAG: hypothetical protein IT343_05620 [Candidatus Melainabacteria bacterium]|nr:hypothetical protein [Candidatus Melainabacteria bacterium]
MNGAFVPFFALFVFVIQGGLLSLLAIELARPHGKKAVGFAVAASVVIAAASGFFWTTALGTALVFTMFAAGLVAGGIARLWAKVVEREIAEQLRMASTVAKFGLDFFHQLDTRGEGEFGTAELCDAIEAKRFSGGNEWLVKHMQKCLSDIGHVADITSHAVVAIPHGAGYVYVSYRVNRRDLETYESRLRTKYGAWL